MDVDGLLRTAVRRSSTAVAVAVEAAPSKHARYTSMPSGTSWDLTPSEAATRCLTEES